MVFSSGNGIVRVDDRWFIHAVSAEVLGIPVSLCPPEELLWSSAFVQERERYDGAAVLHLLHAQAAQLDWNRLLERFGENWPVLLSYLMLFQFTYPDRRADIPDEVMNELTNGFSVNNPSPIIACAAARCSRGSSICSTSISSATLTHASGRTAR